MHDAKRRLVGVSVSEVMVASMIDVVFGTADGETQRLHHSVHANKRCEDALVDE